MDNTVLFSKLALLPENMKSEVADFIDFLLYKTKKEESFSEESAPKKGIRKFGSGKGMFTIMPDFDEPLEDFKDYM